MGIDEDAVERVEARRWPMKQLVPLGLSLTKPASDISSPAGQRQARLLSALLLFLLGAALCSQLFLPLLLPGGQASTIFRASLLTLVPLTVVYLLSRTRIYQVSAVLTVFLLDGLILLFVLSSPRVPTVLIYLVLPVIFGIIYTSIRTIVFLVLFNLAVLLAGLFLAPLIIPTAEMVGITIFYVLISGLSVVVAYQQELVGRLRRTQLMESEPHFRTLAEKALVGVYIIQDGVFRYVNPAFARFFGYAINEIVDQMGPLDLTDPEDRERVESHIRRRLDGETDVSHYFLTGLRKDGQRMHCEVLGRRAEYRGRPAIVGTLLDITESRRAEEALRQSEERLRTYFEQATDWIFTLDSKGKIASVNRQMCLSSGYGAEELLGKPPDIFLQEDSVKRIQNVVRQLLSGEAMDRLEVEVPLRNGRFVWLEIRGLLLRNAEDEITGSFHIARDITERKRAEDAAREAAILYRALFEHTPLGLGISDREGQLIAFNDAMLEPGGYSREDMMSDPSVTSLYCDPDEREALFSLLETDGEALQLPVLFRRKDGSCYDALLSVVPVQLRGKQMQLAVVQDVTEQKRVEAAEREQRVLAEALRDTATVLNSTLELDQVLERILDNVGRVVPHEAANIMLIDGNEAYVVRCQGYYQTHRFADLVMGLRFSIKGTVNFEEMANTSRPFVIADTHAYPGWIKYPQTEWVRSYIGAPISLNNEVIGFLNLDSTIPGFFNQAHADRLQAFADQVAIALRNARLYQELENYSEVLEETVLVRTVELQRTMEQLSVILQNSPDAILSFKFNGTIETANSAFTELFGYEVEEITFHSPHMLVIEEHEEALIKALDRVIHHGQRRRLELKARRKDGSTFDADIALAPVREVQDGGGAVCSLRDISSLKEIDRMKDAFVSNVSHELRTPITSLKLYHDLLSRNPQRQDVYLERLGREINRLSVIVEDLLRLSRLDRGRVDMARQPVDLNQLAAEYVEDRRPLAQEKEITLLYQALPDTLPAWADHGLLEQVLSILLTNALNYTERGGKVIVSVERWQRNGKQWVGWSVRDSGPGVLAADLPHIFDRFYRGGAAERAGIPGTGLGLAIALEIVERHQGQIMVENTEEGAAFTVRLPAFRADQETATTVPV